MVSFLDGEYFVRSIVFNLRGLYKVLDFRARISGVSY